LIEASKASNVGREISAQAAAQQPDSELTSLPLHRIFGSEELSAACDAIKPLIEPPGAWLNPLDASHHNLTAGDSATLEIGSNTLTVTVSISEAIPQRSVGLVSGLPGMPFVAPGTPIRLNAAGGSHV
jgi:NADH-quinone oxidoreductase subunit G